MLIRDVRQKRRRFNREVALKPDQNLTALLAPGEGPVIGGIWGLTTNLQAIPRYFDRRWRQSRRAQVIRRPA